MRVPFAIALATMAVAASPALAQSRPPEARASFVNREGREIGEATLRQTPNGVLIRLGITELPSGPHAVHIHKTGKCEHQGGFQSAGGHYAPQGKKHGFEVDGGPHAGDLPVQWASTEGMMRADILAPDVTLAQGQAGLLDADGSAIIVHAGIDDYQSQPSGNAGQEIACAVVRG
jgi:Cu-Zn family superoxide dismutase